MKLYKIFYIALFLILASKVFGQDLNLCYKRDNTVNTFTTSSVSSDYGRRNHSSFWHKGIDYRGQAGDQLLPVVPGTVKKIINSSDRYKFLILDGEGEGNFGFGHIFYAGNPDLINVEVTGMKLKRLKNS